MLFLWDFIDWVISPRLWVLAWDLFDELWVSVGGKSIWSKVTVPDLGI
jgi:hypothetical protein